MVLNRERGRGSVGVKEEGKEKGSSEVEKGASEDEQMPR